MKAGIFDPYLDTLGGGERYSLTLAEILAREGWEVEVLWDDKALKKKAQERLNLDLSRVKFVPNIFRQQNIFRKAKKSREYRLFFYLSDGSIPTLFAKRNLLHFQVPFHDVGGRSFSNRFKLGLIDSVICNSEFTRRFVDKEYGVSSRVIYPPVGVEDFTPAEKENIVISVGRFTHSLHPKRQDVLIKTFQRLCDVGVGDWKLVLAGGEEDKKEIEKLKKLAGEYQIEIYANVDFSKLRQLYGRAKIFWLATGYGEDEAKKPEKMEHFGITTVEAMASGCAPVVIAKGGQPEIVSDGEDGFLWNSLEELEQKTLQLIKQRRLLQAISRQAIKRSQHFSKERFYESFKKIIYR